MKRQIDLHVRLKTEQPNRNAQKDASTQSDIILLKLSFNVQGCGLATFLVFTAGDKEALVFCCFGLHILLAHNFKQPVY